MAYIDEVRLQLERQRKNVALMDETDEIIFESRLNFNQRILANMTPEQQQKLQEIDQLTGRASQLAHSIFDTLESVLLMLESLQDE